MKNIFPVLFAYISFLPAFSQLTTTQVEWKEFLAPHDMVWDSIPQDYYAGAILGNGMLGTNIYANDNHSFRWDIGRVDVTEKRDFPDGKFNDILFYKARLPIGHFVLTPNGKKVSGQIRLSLYDATAKGCLTTEAGKIDFMTYVDANHDVICIETNSSPGEQHYVWDFEPASATSSRTSFPHAAHSIPALYRDNPNPNVRLKKNGDINLAIQELFSGYVYVTAWKEVKEGACRRILVSVAFEPSVGVAVNNAQRHIESYLGIEKENALKAHKAWWHAYYPASFITFPDAKIESFYWIQQYKLACLTRSDKMIIDLMGPWTYPTPWPALWWNLNIQLTYSSLFTANRMELTEPLWKSLNDNIQTLINNVSVKEWREDAAAIGRSSSYDLKSTLRMDLAKENQYEVGNLTWAMFYYWQYCTYKADTDELLNRFYPLLKRCIAYYSHIIYKGEDGKYHLPLTASPEYKPAEDCNYDLALLRWGLETLLQINREYGLNDFSQTHWEDINQHLTPYPEDATQGFLIGKNVPLSSSHRHYSHLLMIYPLQLITPGLPEDRARITRSLHHWIGMKGALQGYSFTGSSSIYSILGDGERAISSITQLLNNFIQPNTLYKESGPVIETPLSAANSLQESYLRSYHQTITVFPAVPDSWKDLCFINLRAEGGFLVSAIRREGRTIMVQIESTVGGTCRIETGFIPFEEQVHLINGAKVPFTIIDKKKGIIEIEKTKSGDILIIGNGKYELPDRLFQLHKKNEQNFYGYRKNNNK